MKKTLAFTFFMGMQLLMAQQAKNEWENPSVLKEIKKQATHNL